MSIDVGAQVAIILLACGPCVAILNCLGQVLYLGRALHTKEPLPNFREWCRVTRHPRVFHWLKGCQRTPWFRGVTMSAFFVDLIIVEVAWPTAVGLPLFAGLHHATNAQEVR